MIEVKGLVKRFGNRFALRGVDLFVEQGAFVVILGPNGSGKTTLLRILSTLASPTTGLISICGHRLPEQAAGIRCRLGVVSHQPMLYGDLTLVENLRFYGRMYSISHLDERIHEVLDLVGLTSRKKDSVRTLSRGMLQRLAIGRSVLHSPDLLLMDEPHTGLDQEAVTMLDGVLEEVSSLGHTIVMTSHDLARAGVYGTQFHVLAKGVIAASTSREALQVAGGLRNFYNNALGEGTGLA